MKKNKKAGITLIALVITIIVLLILAGISISMLSGDNSILNQAGRARDITGEKSIAERVQIAYLGALAEGKGNVTRELLENALDKEFGQNGYNKPLSDLTKVTIDGKDYKFDGTVTPGDGGGETKTVEELKTAASLNGVTPLSTTDTTTIKDNKDNEIKVPKGFGIATDSGINVAEGIVIEDADSTRQTYRSQFVWVPVGTITKTDSSTETITLGRYTFNTSTGAETAVQTQTGTTYMATTSASVISSYYYEFKDDAESQAIKSATYGNTKAKSISDFVESAISNKGYYIARYEAGISGTTENNSLETKKATDGSVKPQSKSGLGVWNSITQLNAAVVCQSMYNTTNDKVTSDLVNSYAWDTAIVFIQKCGNNGEDSSKYSIQRGYSAINTSARQLTGENKLQYQPGGTTARSIAIFDTQCKICDMAGNIYEWTTETFSATSFPCVSRGGYYDDTYLYTATRNESDTISADYHIGFRPLLYL